MGRLIALGKDPKDNKWKSNYHEPSEPNIAGLPKLPEAWTWASPEQLAAGAKYALAIGPFGSDLKVSDYQNSGVPIVFVRNIRTSLFSGEGTRFVSHKKADELKGHQVKGGDILITKMGDPPGYACIYPDSAPTAVITADCIRLCLSKLLETQRLFFVHSINSSIGRNQILQITKGVAQQKISLSRFSNIALPLPPLEEQTKIVREVERRLSAADLLKATLDQQMARTQVMRRLLLRRAFSGQLLPQHPNDEPASVLIERIRVARSVEVLKSKAKPMTKSKSQSRIVRRPLLDVLQEHNKPMTPEDLFRESGYEHEFTAGRRPQEVVDRFYNELRQLTNPPARIRQRKSDTEVMLLEAIL